MRPEELLDASGATNLTCGAQDQGFDSPRGHSSFAFNLAIMNNEEFLRLLCPIIVNCARITLIVIMCNVAACSD